jgi:RNA polymerase sigma-70 factor, ECF subfamily
MIEGEYNLLGIVKDRSLADDLVGELFLQVWRNAHRFGAHPGLSTWLLAIARDTATAAIKRRKIPEERDEAPSIEDQAARPGRSAEDQAASPGLSTQAINRQKVLHVCVTKLSPNHREILDLVYYHEESIEAVAKIVGIPFHTVTLRMLEARNHFAALVPNGGVDRPSHG